MPIKYVKWITRDMVQASPNAFFVFGDNHKRIGMGGQAGAMRGEPNSIGVATKFAPGMRDVDFFTDVNIAAADICFRIIDADLTPIRSALFRGEIVCVPFDGLGTGLSQLPTRAPSLYAYLLKFFQDNSAPEACPWPSFTNTTERTAL
jgi:hypothetical protein